MKYNDDGCQKWIELLFFLNSVELIILEKSGSKAKISLDNQIKAKIIFGNSSLKTNIEIT